ncbi:hypothetical protein [Mesorhizobium sp.]|uniref:hypothetical protein n=1 Tax=Mesorhizobium sp. TaxID=1871066 RepID=UPI00120F676B|nr:hypothetical protein [Mesorhizobium sp.]TIM07573.1 MAG: hypothetical protein E5Y62_18585 [Mesorhizobium sp.]
MTRKILVAVLFAAVPLATPARASVDENTLGLVAEMGALLRRCPQFALDEGVLGSIITGAGLTKKDLTKEGPVDDFITMRAAEFEVEYQPLSDAGACAKARYFYGPQGTKIPGLLRPAR